MAEEAARHIVDEELREPSSYLTIRRGDRVYDRYGWAVGQVVELRIAPTRDEFFDGLVIDFRGRRVFIDAPEIRALHEGVVLLALTVADLTRAVRDPATLVRWPGGPPQVPARPASEAAAPDDAVGLMAALSRMYVAGALSLETLEQNVERVLSAGSCADLDAIAEDALATPWLDRAHGVTNE